MTKQEVDRLINLLQSPIDYWIDMAGSDPEIAEIIDIKVNEINDLLTKLEQSVK